MGAAQIDPSRWPCELSTCCAKDLLDTFGNQLSFGIRSSNTDTLPGQSGGKQAPCRRRHGLADHRIGGRAHQGRIVEVGSGEICPLEIGASKMGTLEECSVEVHSGQLHSIGQVDRVEEEQRGFRNNVVLPDPAFGLAIMEASITACVGDGLTA
jgi:hypothetical protein